MPVAFGRVFTIESLEEQKACRTKVRICGRFFTPCQRFTDQPHTRDFRPDSRPKQLPPIRKGVVKSTDKSTSGRRNCSEEDERKPYGRMVYTLSATWQSDERRWNRLGLDFYLFCGSYVAASPSIEIIPLAIANLVNPATEWISRRRIMRSR